MFGEITGVATRLKNLFPGITLILCICHSLALCVSNGCSKLPRRCEDLARNIFTFFKHSCKRQAQFAEFQTFFEVEPHKILRISQTRWLSLSQVVSRILEQWQALQTFFTAKWFEERLVAAENIFNDLNDPFIKMYFFFLEWVLPKIVGVNEYFQSHKIVITDVDEKMKTMYSELLLAYISRDHFNKEKLDIINPNETSKFLPFNQMYIGVNVMRELQKPEISSQKENVNDFFFRCRQFLITVCLEIKERYDMSHNNLLSKVAWLNPDIAVSNNSKRPKSIEPLICELIRIVPIENLNLIQAINDQWRSLPNKTNFKDLISSSTTNPIKADYFWYQVRNYKTIDNRQDFKEIGQFALDVLSLPHSSATCERIFSKVNGIKTKSRNKLHTATLQGILSTSECMSLVGCENFEPTEKMINSMTASHIYDAKKNKKQQRKQSV